MSGPKISVIIPTVRDTFLNEACLRRQTFRDFETIIVRPDGEKPKGLFYTLNRDYNRGFKQAKGELIISYQDMIEIKPDTLERFWFYHNHYGGKAIIGAVGDQYERLEPPIKVWSDPRKNTTYGTHYEVNPIDIEFTLCAIPREAIEAVGGMDEEYDRGAAVGEKEMMLRIDQVGYKSYINQDIEYRAIKHDRLTKDWDEHYKIASDLFSNHVAALKDGTRKIHLDYLQ